MAKRVFFSFHYDDVIDFRANVVRQSWVTQDRDASVFFDASVWEESKKTGSLALKRLINSSITGTSVTAVLIGTHTYQRPWVRYEIFRSIVAQNKLIGIHINRIKGKDGFVKPIGENPFKSLAFKTCIKGYISSFWHETGGNWVEYDEVTIPKNMTHPQIPKNLYGKYLYLSKFFPIKDYVTDGGYKNLGNWVGDL